MRARYSLNEFHSYLSSFAAPSMKEHYIAGRGRIKRQRRPRTLHLSLAAFLCRINADFNEGQPYAERSNA